MDLPEIIKQLVGERDMLDRAIASVERIALHRGKRRGRPPAWLTMLENQPKTSGKRGRPKRSASK